MAAAKLERFKDPTAQAQNGGVEHSVLCPGRSFHVGNDPLQESGSTTQAKVNLKSRAHCEFLRSQ